MVTTDTPRHRARRAPRTLSTALALTLLVTATATVQAISSTPASALSCSTTPACDQLFFDLHSRRNFLIGPSANVAGNQYLNNVASSNESARGNSLGAWYYSAAAGSFGAVLGDINGNGSVDLDEAVFYLTAYVNSPDHGSAQARSWLNSAESIVLSAEAMRNNAIIYNGAASNVTSRWNSYLASPFGNLDGASAVFNPLSGRYHQIQVRGWVIDPDSLSPITVRITVNNTVVGTATANATRTDVGAAHPPYGPNHGFSFNVPWSGTGNATVCAIGVNTGPGTDRSFSACRTITVPGAWKTTNLHNHVEYYDTLKTPPPFIGSWYLGKTLVPCSSLPSAMQPPPALPLGSTRWYDCQKVGTRNAAAALSATGGYTVNFVYDQGTGTDPDRTAYRADLVSGNGGFLDPDMTDIETNQPQLPPKFAGAFGVLDILAGYSATTFKVYRATSFRQMYGVDGNGVVWAWKVPMAAVCERRTLQASQGFAIWTGGPTAC